MNSTHHYTNMARAFMAAEMIMAAANRGGSIAARVRAEKLLDDYFALVEQAVPWTEDNSLDRPHQAIRRSLRAMRRGAGSN